MWVILVLSNKCVRIKNDYFHQPCPEEFGSDVEQLVTTSLRECAVSNTINASQDKVRRVRLDLRKMDVDDLEDEEEEQGLGTV